MARRFLVLLSFLTPGPAWAAGGDGIPLVGGLTVLVVACAVLVAFRRGVGLLATALSGAAVAAYLAQHHLGAKSGGGSICNISDTWNCDLVNASEYSELFGRPIALLGFAFYVSAAWLATRRIRGEIAPSALLALLAGLGLVYDSFLGSVMLRMGTGCILCITTYALNLVLFVGALADVRSAFGTHLPAAVSAQGGPTAILGLAAYIGGVMIYGSSAGGTTGGPVNLSDYYEEARGTVEFSATDPAYGDPSARFTMVEWADFECPHCQWMFSELHDLLAEPQNKDVRLIYRNYPISNQCNQYVQHAGHANACLAAAAGECAREAGRFWELSKAMFKNQEYLGPGDIRFMVEQNGMDVALFEQCMAKPETAQAVVADILAGGKAGVVGTPSIYLLGAFGPGKWVRLTGDREEINRVLAAVRAGETLPAPRPPEPLPE